jgi:hypothetical protein
MEILIIIGLVVYFIPAIVGYKKKNAIRIVLLNLFLGWTIVGWVVALVWAVSSPEELPGWIYTCHKCRYKQTLNQRVKLFVCPQCHHETSVMWADDLEAQKQDLPAPAIPPPSEVDILGERVENLRIRFNELGDKIKDSKSEEEKAKLELEQKAVKGEMEKCRLEIFRIK